MNAEKFHRALLVLVVQIIRRDEQDAVRSLDQSKGNSCDRFSQAWLPFSQRMESSVRRSAGQNANPIGDLCGHNAEPDATVGLQLITLHLQMAQRIDSPLLATKSILTIPEALLQLYSALKLDLRFWEAPPENAEHLEIIRRLPQRADFEWPKPGSRLDFGRLLSLGWPRLQALSVDERLIENTAELERLQNLQSQDRNPLSHTLTFSSEEQLQRFAAGCWHLLPRRNPSVFRKGNGR